MRRISRIDRSIDLLRTRTITASPNPHLCRACKQRATSSFSTSALRAARPNEASSFTDKLRKKIWGTDNPPGEANPYGDNSVFDQRKKREKDVQKAQKATHKKEKKKDKIAADSDYEPVDSAEGLEKVGGYGNWWRDNWDPSHQFKSFLPSHIMSDPAEITASLRRAMIEVFALRQTGQPLDGISKDEPSDDLTHDVVLQLSANGPTMDFGSQDAFEGIIQSLVQVVDETAVRENPMDSEQDIAADRSTEDPLHPVVDEPVIEGNPTESEEDVAADRALEDPLHKLSAGSYDELVASWDQSWLQIPLDDPDVKFAVLKRTLQLTGIRLSDAQLKPATNAKTILTHLITPPKPRKLVEALSQKEELMTLPNVSVYSKRVTPIDKHKAIGRWKLIETELEQRGLPVTGRVV